MASLATAIATRVLKKVIERKLEQPSVPVSDSLTDTVAQSAAEAAAPVLVHATNNEPWYQSRVTLGSGFAVLTSLGVVGGMFTGVVDFNVEILAANLATLLGAGFSLWGRWVSKKPLGQ